MVGRSRTHWFNNPQLSDVTLKIGSGDQYQEIKAHKIVCATESGYLENRLSRGHWPGDSDSVCDLRGAAPSHVLLPAIKHIYDQPYYDFDHADDEATVRGRPQPDWSDEDEHDTQASNTVSQDSTILDSTANLSLDDPHSAMAQPHDIKDSDSAKSSEASEAMDCTRDSKPTRHRTLLAQRFFSSPLDIDGRSKLSFHGDMYQCAESWQIPSLTAAITANAEKIFFESVGRSGFAADLVRLFKIDFDDTSFLDAISKLCLKNLELLFKDRYFAQDILEHSPFTGQLLIKVLMHNPDACMPERY